MISFTRRFKLAIAVFPFLLLLSIIVIFLRSNPLNDRNTIAKRVVSDGSSICRKPAGNYSVKRRLGICLERVCFRTLVYGSNLGAISRQLAGCGYQGALRLGNVRVAGERSRS